MTLTYPDRTAFVAKFHTTPTGAVSFGGTLGVLGAVILFILVVAWRFWRRVHKERELPKISYPALPVRDDGIEEENQVRMIRLPWYTIDGLNERLFGPLCWCKERRAKNSCLCDCASCRSSNTNRAVDLSGPPPLKTCRKGNDEYQCIYCKVSFFDYEKGCENIFKLIETIKIVVVFLMGADGAFK
jgi:hypothetical protein